MSTYRRRKIDRLVFSCPTFLQSIPAPPCFYSLILWSSAASFWEFFYFADTPPPLLPADLLLSLSIRRRKEQSPSVNTRFVRVVDRCVCYPISTARLASSSAPAVRAACPRTPGASPDVPARLSPSLYPTAQRERKTNIFGASSLLSLPPPPFSIICLFLASWIEQTKQDWKQPWPRRMYVYEGRSIYPCGRRRCLVLFRAGFRPLFSSINILSCYPFLGRIRADPAVERQCHR